LHTCTKGHGIIHKTIGFGSPCTDTPAQRAQLNYKTIVDIEKGTVSFIRQLVLEAPALTHLHKKAQLTL